MNLEALGRGHPGRDARDTLQGVPAHGRAHSHTGTRPQIMGDSEMPAAIATVWFGLKEENRVAGRNLPDTGRTRKLCLSFNCAGKLKLALG